MSDNIPLGSAVPRRRVDVLVLMDSANVSGPVRQLAAVIRPLKQRDFLLHCVIFQRRTRPTNPSIDFLRSMGARVSILSDSRAFEPSLLFRLRELIAAAKPDIVESHGYRPSVLMALLRVTGWVKTAWIGYFHGRTAESLLVKSYDKLDHFALRFADLVVVMSDLQRREKRNYSNEVRVLYNAAITETSEAASDASLNDRLQFFGKPFVGVIGRLSPEKGVDVALEAWRTVVAEGHAGTLVIAGDGPERGSYQDYVAAHRLGSRVCFLGHLDGTRHLYPLLGLLVIPSRSEGLPNVFIEALRNQLPIVSTRVGAVPELVNETSAAILVEPNDSRSLAAAIQQAIDPGSTLVSQHAAQALVLATLSLGTRVSKIGQTFTDVLSSSRRGARVA